jgi:hypothetical protein
MLERIDHFCQKIDEWDKEKHQLILNEKKIFAKFIENVTQYN